MADVYELKREIGRTITEMGYNPLNLKIKSFVKNDTNSYLVMGEFDDYGIGLGNFNKTIEFKASFNDKSRTLESFEVVSEMPKF